MEKRIGRYLDISEAVTNHAKAEIHESSINAVVQYGSQLFVRTHLNQLEGYGGKLFVERLHEPVKAGQHYSAHKANCYGFVVPCRPFSGFFKGVATFM